VSEKRGHQRLATGFLPYNPELVERAREMRKHPTPAERKLWYDFLRTFKYRVMRQRPIDNFIVDFYCAELKLVIEVDGDSYYTQASLKNDSARTAVLEGYGLRVLRFTNRDVLDNFEAVCDAIAGIPPTPLTKGGSLHGDE
jgi:very-short-patch-repair endonuclease